MKNFYVGAAYYPELWDEAEEDKDIRKMSDLGLNCMRIGEFAWSKMEPTEGDYRFDWLHRIVDKLYAHGISTVLCTPTCTPPKWLFNKYPSIMRTRYDGVRDRFVSRCHPCKSSTVMRAYNRKITEKLATEFKDHPGVIGWQLDNELFPYDGGCFCDDCKENFRKYLQKKYGTVENLNAAWGMDRWSLDYPSFADVEPPMHGWLHPSLKTEWFRFQCDLIVDYAREQAEEIRKHSSAPIGTDMMATPDLSYGQMLHVLDKAQYNHYNTEADLPQTAFAYDFLRTVGKQPFWVTETQVGWNGSEFAASGPRHEGNIYVNSFLPLLLGGQMNLYWLFRAHRAGHEIGHGALLNAAGRPYREAAEVKRLTTDIAKIEDFLTNSNVQAKIALHYSNTSALNFRSAPIVQDLDYRRYMIEKIYPALVHHTVDVIETEHSLDGYDTVLSPMLTTLTEADFISRVLAWVERGGTWIVGPLSDCMSDCTTHDPDSPCPHVEQAAGVYISSQLPVNNDTIGARWKSGEPLSVSGYYDAIECVDKNAQPLATYTSGVLRGAAAVTQTKVGKGRIIVLGSFLGINDLKKLLGDPVAQASDNVRAFQRTGKRCGLVLVETACKEGTATLCGKYKDLLGGKTKTGKITLSPYEILVLEKVE